jgi:hypothetical protein
MVATVRVLSEEKRDRLAALGLAELVACVHKMERDSGEPWHGELAARERHPDLFPDDDASGASDRQGGA